MKDASVGGVPVGADEEVVTVFELTETAFDAVDERNDGRVRFAEILEENVFALGGDAVADVEDEPMSVVGGFNEDVVNLAQGLAFILMAEDDGIAAERGAEDVIEDGGALAREEFRVEDAFSVQREGDAVVARAGQDVEHILAGGDVEEVDGEFIGASDADAVGEDGAVGGNVHEADGGVAVGAEGIAVDELTIGSVEAGADEEGGLVVFLQAPREEVEIAALPGDAHGVDTYEFGKLGLGFGEGLHLVEVLGGVGVFFADEGARGGAVRVFEPAVGVGYGDGCAGALVLVGDGLLLDRGRVGQGDAAPAGNLGGAVAAPVSDPYQQHGKPESGLVRGKHWSHRQEFIATESGSRIEGWTAARS